MPHTGSRGLASALKLVARAQNVISDGFIVRRFGLGAR